MEAKSREVTAGVAGKAKSGVCRTNSAVARPVPPGVGRCPFSKCFCFRILDRLADSRFDIIRLRFRSSTTEAGRLGSPAPPEPDFGSARLLLSGSSSGSSEQEPDKMGLGDWAGSPEPDEFEVTSAGLGKGGRAAGKSSWQSQGVNPPSKEGNGFPRIESEEGKMEGKVEIIMSFGFRVFSSKGGRERSWGKGKKCSAGDSYLC
ncbi:hypothetical protein TIFTF001_004586 [Ficus carica]|uniref:Uncharacterized protein n=1 Tax=Ficus carica TaxID=3494 RepID=A0AA87ZDH9_FICCA|nr:hypothetical protein TIFTF001_004586 [Ficus carica]